MYGDRGGGGFGQRRRFVPVKVGDELDVKIEAVGEKGDGIAKKEGFVLFIPGAKQGDEVRVRVTKVLRKVGFADVVGSASGEIPAEQPAEQAPAEPEQAPIEEPLPGEEQQDTEDFGEEPAEKPAEEKPEEAPAEEAPEEKKEE